MVRKLLQLVRWDDWYDSKLPLLAATAYFLSMNNPLPWPESGLRVALTIAFSALFLGYGYAVNDFSDIKADRLAGKSRVIADIPLTKAVFFLAILALLGICALVPYYGDPKVVVAVLACYLLGTAYSLAPIRLKERGLGGLLGSAIAQRSMPVLVMGAVWGSTDIALLGWVLLGFVVGVRYILIHQYQDLDADRRSGVTTYAAENPHTVARSVRLVLAAEIGILSLLLLRFSPNVSAFIVVVAAYSLYSIVSYLLAKRYCLAPSLLSFSQVPLADVYSLFLPLGYLILLITYDIRWLPFLLIEILWKRRFATQCFSSHFIYLSSKLQGLRQRMRRL